MKTDIELWSYLRMKNVWDKMCGTKCVGQNLQRKSKHTFCVKYISPPPPENVLKYKNIVDSSSNVMAHGDAREGNWRGNWRMEWVSSTLHTISEHGVSNITTADARTSAASSRLNWRSPADLNGFVRFAERRNIVSARVPSHFNWPLHPDRPQINNIVRRMRILC